jgi:hypothetical protein
MGKEQKNLQMAIYTKDNTPKVNPMATGNITGQMGVTSKEILETACEMVTVCGRKVPGQVTNMRDSTRLIRSMAMAYFHGLRGISIKEIMTKI